MVVYHTLSCQEVGVDELALHDESLGSVSNVFAPLTVGKLKVGVVTIF